GGPRPRPPAPLPAAPPAGMRAVRPAGRKGGLPPAAAAAEGGKRGVRAAPGPVVPPAGAGRGGGRREKGWSRLTEGNDITTKRIRRVRRGPLPPGPFVRSPAARTRSARQKNRLTTSTGEVEVDTSPGQGRP